MQKNRLLTAVAALAMVCGFSATPAAAQDVPASRILTENFDYSKGNLYQYKTEWGTDDWMQYGTQDTNPVQVVEGSLVYDGYMNEAIANSMQLAKTTSNAQDVMRKLPEPVGSGSVYVSFLLRPTDIARYCGSYFFSLFAETKNGMKNRSTGTETGRLFAVGCEGGLQLGIHRVGSNTACIKAPTVLTAGETYLVVVEYQIVDGNTNDVMRLWVNPATDSTGAPTADAEYSGTSGGDISLTYGGIGGLEFRQGGSSYVDDTPLQIDALRVATSWTGLFDARQATTATITASPNRFSSDPVIAGTPVKAMTLVTAAGLSDDITVTCSEGMSADMTTISKDDSDLAADGVPLNITATPNPAQSTEGWTGTVTLSSPGAEDEVITMSMPVQVVSTVAQAARIPVIYDSEGAFANTYKYTGKATVTYLEQQNYYSLIYAQDMTGAFCINTSYCDFDPSTINIGDVITNIIFMISDEDAVGLQILPMQMSENAPVFEVTETGKFKTPTEISLDDFNPADNQYKLVRLNNAQFAATGTFAAQSYDVTVDSKNAKVRPFAGTDLIGTDIPASADVIGISKSKSAVILWPRSTEDIVAGAPFANITTEALFSFENNAAPINQDTPIAKITVESGSIAADAPIYITGANANMFRISPEVIPAGNATTEVTVTYHPTAAGKHKANIYFDFDGTSSELNQSVAINGCMAYDPDNLPTLSLDPAELTLRANVGETARATATLNVANAFDNIYVNKGNQDAAGIIINSAMFIPSLAQQTVTITFQPLVEGNVEQTFTFTTVKGEPVTLTVHGIVSGGVEPEPVEGGDLSLDTSNAHAIYTQDFSGVVNNKPLEVAEWCNVAVEGTRAWWGYIGEDFTAAKVTAYDSRVQPGDGTPCQMLLVSPALSYVDAPSKTLKFRLMGKGLHDDMTDLLEICLIELIDGEPVISPMQGFEIPATADMSDQWINYDNIDMSVVPDMPDVFFIGFRFTSTRGRDNAAQYYMTDFSWGNYPTGVCDVEVAADGFYTVYTMQGMRVMHTDNAADLDRLPAGLYIINGKKVMRK